ncbi:hypothetical protein EYC98_03110 [Halieaceae bacterium IMCC14734]|uniref:DUF3971 domain-containing protein n=1 Tax=Candidatus Litorirhabdus singularis TaxID=2518993 RepID=A0ABT3TC58_9GAMM|nr:hypothetical protein [Candidatus Litorirhabdus singularis]MCX2979848.1 hypothetical protein [Candidatus Litorirhabdus singularis]
MRQQPLKRFLIIGSSLFLLIVLIASAQRIVGGILDYELAGRLTPILGLPVSIEKIDVDLIGFNASTARVLLGDPKDPLIDATAVRVGLSWAKLLRGEIRLIEVAVDDLSVKPSRWQQQDTSPDAYQFLEPWLPNRLDLAQGRYVTADDKAWPIMQVGWRRQPDGGASLYWTSPRPGGDLRIEADITSLPALLQLTDIEGRLKLLPQVMGVDGADIGFSLAPVPEQGYAVKASGRLAKMQVQLSAFSDTPWEVPQRSVTKVERLDPEPLQQFYAFLMGTGEASSLEEKLLKPVPQLALPRHQAILEISSLTISGDALTDNRVIFSSGESGLQVESAISHGPGGVLNWSGGLHNLDQGLSLELEARLTASEDGKGLLPSRLNAQWLWQEGTASVSGRGSSWGALVDDLEGAFALAGFHLGETRTPLLFKAQLDRSPKSLVLQPLQLEVGSAAIFGRLEFAGGGDRRLHTTLRGGGLDLSFMFNPSDDDTQVGVAMPAFLLRYPGVDLNWDIELEAIKIPIADLAGSSIKVVRDAAGGKLEAELQGHTGGELDMLLSWENQPAQPIQVKLDILLRNLNLDRTFGQDGYGLDSRTNGSLEFTSTGEGLEDIFTAMRGSADLSVKLLPENGWSRNEATDSEIGLAGHASLILGSSRIIGVKISELRIASLSQDVTGDISMQANRTPWLIAGLRSSQLDLGPVIDSLPASDPQSDPLDFLRELGASRISLDAGKVTYGGIEVHDLAMTIDAERDAFRVSKLDFDYEGAQVSSQAQLDWHAEETALNASADFKGLVLEGLLQPNPDLPNPLLQGGLKIASHGRSLTDLVNDLQVQLRLESAANKRQQLDERRYVEADITRRADGVDVNLGAFVWAGSDLRGELSYTRGDPAEIDLNLVAGTLNLEPWESVVKVPAEPPAQLSLLQEATRATTEAVRELLSAPYRQLNSSDAKGMASGTTVFRPDPYDLSLLSRFNVKLYGSLEHIRSQAGTARDVTYAANLRDGTLSFDAGVGALNGGEALLEVRYAGVQHPPQASLLARFKDVYKTGAKQSYPQSGYFELRSEGDNAAALAANLDGLVYLELGQGPFNFGRIGFLTADVAGSLVKGLIPSAKHRAPKLNCAITLGTFKDGVGITPYGYAARTRSANLLGKMEVDLGREQIKASFRSRSREGMGISIGNAFSNTVSVQGPLSHPQIVPNTGSLLFRSWAAYMTVGMSILGESMYNRVLASADPCEAIRVKIRENICVSEQPIASSPLVCPSP